MQNNRKKSSSFPKLYETELTPQVRWSYLVTLKTRCCRMLEQDNAPFPWRWGLCSVSHSVHGKRILIKDQVVEVVNSHCASQNECDTCQPLVYIWNFEAQASSSFQCQRRVNNKLIVWVDHSTFQWFAIAKIYTCGRETNAKEIEEQRENSTTDDFCFERVGEVQHGDLPPPPPPPPLKMYAGRPLAGRKKWPMFGSSLPLNQSSSETVLANFFYFAWTCVQEQDLSNEGSNVLLDLVKAELRFFKADSKPSMSSVGTSVSYRDRWKFTYIGTDHIHWDHAWFTRALVEHRGREDECFTVEFETNTSLSVDSVRLWSGISCKKSGRWRGEMTERPSL